jgi:hypothetical protein
LPSSNRKITRQFARTVTAQKTLKPALQWVQAKRRQSQCIDRFRRVQHAQNLTELTYMLGVQAPSRIVLEELPQPFMLEALDHCFGSLRQASTVKHYLTYVKLYFTHVRLVEL